MKQLHLKTLDKNDLLSVKNNNNNGPKLSKITIISGYQVYEVFVVMHCYQGMAACCTFVFPSQLPDKVFHHNLGMVVYSFENVPANQFHNSDYRKSSYSILTTHRSLKEEGKINEINQSTRTSRRGPKLIFQVQGIDLKLLVTNLNCYELKGFLFSSFFGHPCTEFESPLD